MKVQATKPCLGAQEPKPAVQTSAPSETDSTESPCQPILQAPVVSGLARQIHFFEHFAGPILQVAVLVLAALVITRGIGRGEFHLNIDEAFHATTGLYFADFLHDLPLHHPVKYTYEYYAQYPALALIHWPPFFYFVEGIMFSVFGPSVVTARLTVLLFALLGMFFWFKLVRELQNVWAAAISTIVLACLPSLLLYEKAVMLEVPSLSLCIAASYFWIRYLKSEEPRTVYWFTLFASLALLTKQQSIYLALLCLFTVVGLRKWRLLLKGSTLRALGLCLLITGPFYALDLIIDRQTIIANVLKGITPVRHPFTYYLRALPHQLGSVLLALSVIGLVTRRWWKKPGAVPVMLAWIAAWYVTYALIGTETTRYMVYWLPPFIYFAVAPLTARRSTWWFRPAALAVVLGLIGSYTWTAWAYQRPFVSGYETLATQILKSAQGGVVLFDGDLAGNFIFYMRALDPNRRFVVLRKALYVTRVMPQFGKVELIHTPEELEDLLARYGIKYVAVEDHEELDFHAQKILRGLLTTPQFQLAQKLPIDSNMPEWKTRHLLLYENLDVKRRTAHLLRLKMLSMDRDIVVPLDDLLKR